MERRIRSAIRTAMTVAALACATTASADPRLVGIAGVGSGSLLFATKIPGRHVPAPLVATDVDIAVGGPIARVNVRQTFVNPSRHWLEGRYVFPLPHQSAVHRMVLRGPDMEILAEIKEREAAREIYRHARQSGRRAALVEQHRPNIFTTSVANLPPGGAIDVEISYLQRVRYDQGRFKLRFPLVVAPRFTPPDGVRMARAAKGDATTPGADDALPKSPVLHPDKGKLNPVRLKVRLDAGIALASLKSTNHQITATDWKSGTSEVTLAKSVVPADRDFELVWEPAPEAQPGLAVFRERLGDEIFVLAMVLPPAPDRTPAPLPRDVVFVLDKSGSMAGASIRQARKALVYALERLRPDDRFNILRFANRTETLFRELRPASAETKRHAIRYVEETKAEGGTNMRPALLAALAGAPVTGRLRQIVFLTDAAVGNEAQLFDEIAARIGQNRLFTVGIGSAPNSYFMQRAAELGRGSFTYIGNTQKVGEVMRALFRKIERPAATGLAAEWDGFAAAGHRIDAYPGRLPDLYDGEPLILATRIKGGDPSMQNAALIISGEVGRTPWRKKIGLSTARPVEGAGTLWGRARIKNLMMSLHRGADPISVRQAVTATALRHHIVSRYTSLVAAEKQIARPVDEPVYRRALPRNLPDGWVFEKVFGDVLKTEATEMVPISAPGTGGLASGTGQNAAAQQRALLKNGKTGAARRAPLSMVTQNPSVRLPAGGTAATLNLIVGVLLVVIGLILRRRRSMS